MADFEQRSPLEDLAVLTIDQMIQRRFLEEYNQELAESLVRQWSQFGGVATLILGDQQFYYRVAGPIDRPNGINEESLSISEWKRLVQRDWAIGDDDWTGLVEGVNRWQTAETTNERGQSVTLWVNPGDRSKGVESLEPNDSPGPDRPLLRKMAQDAVDAIYTLEAPQEARDAVAISVVRQWLGSDHRAWVLLPNLKFCIRLHEAQSGGRRVSREPFPNTFIDELFSGGLTVDEAMEILQRLNIGHSPMMRRPNGETFRLVVDPRTGDVLQVDVGEDGI